MNNFDLINFFRQGIVNLHFESNLGNCASKALIKASIEIFGINNLFDYSKNGNIHHVILKDGTRLSFTTEEFKRSNDVLRFVPDDSKLVYKNIYDYAKIAM